jgi:hypothetical protein
VSIVLGWGYLVNDEKVSAIGRYVRIDLTSRIAALAKISNPEYLFGWEIAHRSDARRRRRKIAQLAIDLVTFVVSGSAALIAFCVLVPTAHSLLKGVAIVEGLMLLWLGIEIIVHADLKSGR